MSDDPNDWRDVVGYEGHYRVSRFAEVMSLKALHHGKILKGTISSNGYRCVALHKDRKQTTHPVHHLVANAFIPRVEGKPWINHIDHSRSNDRWDNLEWCTPAENTLHCLYYGPGCGGPRKLTDAQAQEIRDRKAKGDRSVIIAADFNIGVTLVDLIARGAHYIPGTKFTRGLKVRSRVYE